MIRKGKTKDGHARFIGNIKDLQMVSTWVQCFLHLAYGPEAGEKRYRKIRMIDAMDLWSKQQTNE